MAHLRRKALIITIRKLCKPQDNDDDDCDLPPQSPTLETHSHSPLKVLLICTLAATFSFLCYIILIKTCRAFQTRRRNRNVNVSTNQTQTQTQTHHDFFHEDPVVLHPAWLINTIGLDQSVIDSIQMFNYRKEDGFMYSDCPVCLGVFQEDESLRILPKCSHAFHVFCIDTWLRSHRNCPLCRAPVVINNSSINQADQNSFESTTQEQIPSSGPGNPQEIDTDVVRVQSDLTNHCCQKLEPIRRSVSLGSHRFVHQELVVSKKPDVGRQSGKRRGLSSSTVEEGRALRSGQE